MEVGRARLGLPPDQFVGVARRPPVVGRQGQVDGQALAASRQAAGQVGDQGAVEATLQGVEVGQVVEQRRRTVSWEGA